MRPPCACINLSRAIVVHRLRGRMRIKVILSLIVMLSWCAFCQERASLAATQLIPLPKMQGGFNHMSVDAANQRLFAAAPTNQTLEIIDVGSGTPFRSLDGEKPAAARYAREFHQLYVPRGQSLYIYDGKTFDLITKVDIGSNLDELQYDPRAKELYVGCMTGEKTGIAVIAIPEGKLVAKIPLPAKPQGLAVEQKGYRIFANMPTLQEIAVIDRRKKIALEPWKLTDAEGNTPVALDEDRHRLFVGTRRPAQLVVLDTSTGRSLAKVDINNDTDDLFYDPAHKRVYVSCGEGFVDVITQEDADRYRLLRRVPTVAGARTSTFSTELNRLFVGIPRRGEQPAEIRAFQIE